MCNVVRPCISTSIFTRGQFWPSGIVICFVCLCVSVSLSVCFHQSRACLCDNLSLVQPRITKFGPEGQNTLFNIAIVRGWLYVFVPVGTPPPPSAADFCPLLNNFFDFFHLWQNCWPWPIDYLIRFWSIFVVTLTFNFEGQIWNLLYLTQKWSDCHETNSKHIDWTLGLKCDQWVWPWPWPWPWIFKVKHRICYISAKNGPIATKRKANISAERKTSNVTIWFDLGMTMTLIFQGQIWNLLNLSEHIEWTPGLKCDQWVWPWQWPWSMNFQGQMWPRPFDRTHGVDQGFSWSNFERALYQNGRADWHWTKGVGQGHSWPWPFGDQGQVKGSTT